MGLVFVWKPIIVFLWIKPTNIMPKTSIKVLSEKLEAWQNINFEKNRNDWSLKFGRMAVSRPLEAGKA